MATTALTLRKTPIKKLFFSYLIPSLLGMVLMAINILVDGVFISIGVGEIALAGVNIAVPIFSILLSISLWIGIGGATLYSIEMGKNNYKKAIYIFTQSIMMTIVIVGFIVLGCLWKQEEIAYLFGASPKIFPYVEEYLKIILFFGIVFVLEEFLSIFVRNDGNPKLVMTSLITTSILNIILNYIFIFNLNMGVKGAAYALALSTLVGLIVLLFHFFTKKSNLKFKRYHFDIKLCLEILKIGFPSFITEGTVAIVVVGYNIAFRHFVGEIGVTSYAIVNYLHSVFIMVFTGIGLAIQPIVSFSYGAQLKERLQQVLKLGLKTGIICGLVILLLGWFFDDQLIGLFGVNNQEVIFFTKDGITLFFIGYLFLSFNLIHAEYYQAIKKIRLSMMITIMRSIVFLLPLLYILPALLNNKSIWLAFTIAEILTTIVIIIYKRSKSTTNSPIRLKAK